VVTRTPVDGVNTRTVLIAYAIVAGVAGLRLLGSLPFPQDGAALGVPFLLFSMARVLGTGLVLLGLTGLGIAAIGAPVERRRVLGWFVAGHGVVLMMLVAQRYTVWPGGLADWIVAVWGIATVVLFYAWSTAFGDPAWGRGGRSSLFVQAPESGPDRERSRVEQQIRLTAAQEERNRLARDLHDSIRQQIFAIQTAAATAEARLEVDAEGARHEINAVRASARDAMVEMDAMTESLRATPLENVGLVQTLKHQVEALALRTGADVQLKLGTLPKSEWLPPGAQEAVFRVAQEALANVARHARATKVAVSLDAVAGDLVLLVTDNGQGFEARESAGGDGIANMRARAAEFQGHVEIATQPTGGTVVRFSLPYAERTAQEFVPKIRTLGVIFLILVTLGALRRSSADWLWWMGLIVVGLELLRYANAWRRTRAIATR
jgi:signal transduction histidine kinase